MVTLALCLVVGAPVALSGRYAVTQADLVTHVFEDNESATAPADVTVTDPWGGRDRVNVLLLGGDGQVGRYGIRTDSVVLVSMSTRTGDTVMFCCPRNMMNAPFPEGSPLHDAVPRRLPRRAATLRRTCSTRSTDRCRRCTRESSVGRPTRAPTR